MEAQVVCRPAGTALFHERRNTRNISLGGMRVYADDDYPVGSRLDLEVLLADDSSVRCWAEVVWRLELGNGAPARFDFGLRFSDMAPRDLQKLAAVLVRAR